MTSLSHLAELARAATLGAWAIHGIRTTEGPDGAFIAAANPDVVLALLDVCAAAERTSRAIHVPTRKDDLAGLADLREALARLDAVVGVTDEMVEIAIGGWNARLDELRGGGYMISHGNTRDRHQMKAALQAALARFDAVMGNDDNNKGTT